MRIISNSQDIDTNKIFGDILSHIMKILSQMIKDHNLQMGDVQEFITFVC